MYTATIGIFLAKPLVMNPYVLAIVTHIKDEEKLLTKELEGYQEYKEKVRWRLVPYIWQTAIYTPITSFYINIFLYNYRKYESREL